MVLDFVDFLGLKKGKILPRQSLKMVKETLLFIHVNFNYDSFSASGIVRPGEFLAIMGASGAGKSTLLNTLLFRNLTGLRVSGSRLANNQLVTPTSLTSVSAYVQQDDLFIGTLTVREHLNFQALVRMDADIPKKTRFQRVDDVIQEVS